MSQIFTNVGEFRRGKGNRKTRLGPKIRAEGYEKQGGGKQTPDDIAIKKLQKLLVAQGFGKDISFSTAGSMNGAEQIRFMNMPVLAAVLNYMRSVNNDVNPDNFNYVRISGFIDNLLPRREVGEGGVKSKDLSNEELEIIRLRLAATFLRYIRYILLLRQEADMNFAAEQAHQAQMDANIIEEW